MRGFILAAVLAVASLAGSVPSAGAADYYDGYVDGGYTYHNGYWWNGDHAYSRTWANRLVYKPTWHNGYYYQSYPCYEGYWAYTYYPSAVRYVEKPVVKAVEKVSYKDPSWRQQLLDIAAARDKVEGELRKSALEHNEYLEAVNALGLTGNFRWNGYGDPPAWPQGYRGYGAPTASLQLGSHGVQGNTVYGYSTSTVADLYGNTDLNALYQQSAKLTEQAQDAGTRANDNFNARVEQATASKERVAEALARGAAARAALEAAAGPPTARVETRTTGSGSTTTTSTGTGPAPAATPPAVLSITAGDKLRVWQASSDARCVSCHKDGKNGFNPATFPSMTADQKAAVTERLLSTDPGHRMPKGPNGTPGKTLPADELRAWLSL